MRRIALLLAGALLIAAALPGVVAAAKPTTGSYAVPVTGTPVGGGSVTGTIDITRFATQNGQVVALGTFTGSVTTAAGAVTSGTQALALPVTSASCEILNLVLGPLDLNLLGLQVHLDQVVLDITAVPGAGNLLGNLLCAVAGLLDGGGPLGGITALLNRILSILSQL